MNGRRISNELVGIFVVGVALAGLTLALNGGLEAQIERLSGRIDHIEVQIGERIDRIEVQLNGRIDRIEAQMHSTNERIEAQMHSINERLARLEGRIEGLGYFAANRLSASNAEQTQGGVPRTRGDEPPTE